MIAYPCLVVIVFRKASVGIRGFVILIYITFLIMARKCGQGPMITSPPYGVRVFVVCHMIDFIFR
jgi:hypothetical protein